MNAAKNAGNFFFILVFVFGKGSQWIIGEFYSYWRLFTLAKLLHVADNMFANSDFLCRGTTDFNVGVCLTI
jgi:hypothetical protein